MLRSHIPNHLFKPFFEPLTHHEFPVAITGNVRNTSFYPRSVCFSLTVYLHKMRIFKRVFKSHCTLEFKFPGNCPEEA